MVGCKEMHMTYAEAVQIKKFQNAFLFLSTFGQAWGGGWESQSFYSDRSLIWWSFDISNQDWKGKRE